VLVQPLVVLTSTDIRLLREACQFRAYTRARARPRLKSSEVSIADLRQVLRRLARRDCAPEPDPTR
jgi:hypothetical protein